MAIFFLITKNLAAAGDFALRFPSVIHLSYSTLPTMSPNFNIFTFQHLLQVLPLQQNPGCAPNQATASDLSFYDIFAP